MADGHGDEVTQPALLTGPDNALPAWQSRPPRAPAHPQLHATHRWFLLTDWPALLPLAAALWGVACSSWGWAAASLVVTSALLWLGPYSPLLRRRAEALRERQRLAEMARRRKALLARIDPALRREFEDLEALVGRVRQAAPWPTPGDAERLLNLGEQLDAFAHLALALKFGGELLEGVDRSALARERDGLESTSSEDSETGRAAGLRRSVVVQRIARWDRTRDQLEAIKHQLGTLSGAIRLVHEQCFAPDVSPAAGRVLREAVGRLERNEELLRELGPYADDRSWRLWRIVA